jgi:hypothetical protein
MEYVYKVTYRYNYGTKPFECRDVIEGFWKTLEGARDYVKKMLGAEVAVNDEWGFDIWKSPRHPRTEMFIEKIELR